MSRADAILAIMLCAFAAGLAGSFAVERSGWRAVNPSAEQERRVAVFIAWMFTVLFLVAGLLFFVAMESAP